MALAAILGMTIGLISGVASAQADPLDKPLYYDLVGQASQGGLLIGQARPGSKVMQDGREVPVAPNGAFLIGFGRLYPAYTEIRVELPDHTIETRSIPVLPRVYAIQRIDGLPEHYVEPSPEDLKRIKEEQHLIRVARAHRSKTADFQAGFIWPVIGTITGVYGSQRVLNGEPRAPHLGVDIAAGRGTTVVAASRGTVVLARHDLFFNGNVVMLDHGLGLTSVYVHLDAIAVREGDTVNIGAPIGAVGATGRATGPHLHWGVHLRGEGIDPQILAGPMPQK